jgi:hypothetical protein
MNLLAQQNQSVRPSLKKEQKRDKTLNTNDE